MQNRGQKRKAEFNFFSPNKRMRLDEDGRHFRTSVDYSQNTLLEKINTYLAARNRPLLSTGGHCWGLALLWLRKMATGKVAWFYRTRDRIIDSSRLNPIKSDVELFISAVDYLQNKMNEHQLKKSSQDEINQKLGLEKKYFAFEEFAGAKENLTELFSARGKTLVMRNPTMYMVSSDLKRPGIDDHSIAVYQSHGAFYVFDSNYADGRPKIIMSLSLLVEEILNCLFRDFKDPVPEPLKISIVKIRDPKALQLIAPTDDEWDDDTIVTDKEIPAQDVPTIPAQDVPAIATPTQSGWLSWVSWFLPTSTTQDDGILKQRLMK